MWLSDFRSAYLEAVLSLLWRHWSTLGLMGQREGSDTWILDPEALVVATIQFGRYDPRLLDGAVQWWLENGKWLSSTRLQRLQKSLHPMERRIVSAIVDVVLSEQKSAKWKRLAEQGKQASPARQEALFLLADGKALPRVGPDDPVFLRHGFLRPRLVKRRIVRQVPMDKPGALRIKLRAFFGLTSRAEIALFLLTHERAHSRLVARHVQYAQSSVSTALREMAASGLISETSLGREVEYKINKPVWESFFNVPGELRWVTWFLVFRALREIWDCIESMQGRRATISVLGSEFLQCAQRIKRALHESEIGFTFTEARPGEFRNYAGIFAEDGKRLFERLGIALEFTPPVVENESQLLS